MVCFLSDNSPPSFPYPLQNRLPNKNKISLVIRRCRSVTSFCPQTLPPLFLRQHPPFHLSIAPPLSATDEKFFFHRFSSTFFSFLINNPRSFFPLSLLFFSAIPPSQTSPSMTGIMSIYDLKLQILFFFLRNPPLVPSLSQGPFCAGLPPPEKRRRKNPEKSPKLLPPPTSTEIHRK